jgi:hypothetical protein
MDIEKMTIREVANATENIPIVDGGLRFMIEKIIMEIEKLQQFKKNE